MSLPVEDFYMRTDADNYDGFLVTLEDVVRYMQQHDTGTESTDFIPEYTSKGYQYLGSVPGSWFHDDLGTLVIDRIKPPLGKKKMLLVIVISGGRRYLFAEPESLPTGHPNTPDVSRFTFASLAGQTAKAAA